MPLHMARLQNFITRVEYDLRSEGPAAIDGRVFISLSLTGSDFKSYFTQAKTQSIVVLRGPIEHSWIKSLIPDCALYQRTFFATWNESFQFVYIDLGTFSRCFQIEPVLYVFKAIGSGYHGNSTRYPLHLLVIPLLREPEPPACLATHRLASPPP
ncbi:hypothetical protein BT96DRAFT_1020812 [Gymnopus androsaceus JB14]|uniref:Uncharacterized protein n=1 Tax=Gymnopus androsaceus JB14 TaxID=1447944 RepID=A0A6A4HIF5_9AGAR|nr:hypothetical protein BT96DRAFT_1020812 [Gymnopus androsaceus JB14]